MTSESIAFIGGGNMAGSMIGGVLAQGWNAQNIWASDPEPATRARLATQNLTHTQIFQETK